MDQLRLQATDPTFLTQAAMSTDNNATNYTAKKGKYGAEKKCDKRKKKHFTFSIAQISYPIWIPERIENQNSPDCAQTD